MFERGRVRGECGAAEFFVCILEQCPAIGPRSAKYEPSLAAVSTHRDCSSIMFNTIHTEIF